MGFIPTGLFRSRDATRQRLPLYERAASPASNKEDYYESSDDDQSDGYYSSALSSPRSTHGSRQSSGSASASTMMLPKRAVAAAANRFSGLPHRRRAAAAVRGRLPSRYVRYLCVAMMTAIVLFIGGLVRASQLENRRIANGQVEKPPPPPPAWESFDFLTRYYGGVRNLVPLRDNVPQYPREEDEQPFNVTFDTAPASDEPPKTHLRPATGYTPAANSKPLPASSPFESYQGSVFADAAAREGVVPCFIDSQKKVGAPPVRYFAGRPNGFPDNIMGSYELLSLPEDICFERYGRYGPYGYGYSVRSGGLGVGEFGEKEGADAVWQSAHRVDYRSVDWADVQKRCYSANARRFKETPARKTLINGMYINNAEPPKTHHATRDESAPPAAPVPAAPAAPDVPAVPAALAPAAPAPAVPAAPAAEAPAPPAPAPPSPPHGDAPRTAVVVRCWDEFEWHEEDIMNMRALITELSLASGARYDVHILVQIKDDIKHPVWADDDVYRQRIVDVIPEEFRGLVTLWTETQMLSLYHGIHDLFTRGPDLPVHGVYRGLQMAMQQFAHNHPEYDYFWQWEMDIRYTGHMLDLLTKMETWSRQQPRKGLWERNARFYMPSVHGAWDDFRQMARVQSEVGLAGADNIWNGVGGGKNKDPKKDKTRAGEQTVWGPVRPADPKDWFEAENDPVPPTTYEKDRYVWGVGEEADLITLNPLFDPEGTTWLLADDITGYNDTAEGGRKPPRRAQIITASRMSRRLLRTMHRETALQKHHAFSEMWPATAALQHGYKAVYVPHPVYVDREWPTQYMARTFNGGRNGASGGGRTSVFGQREHNFLGLTWYYNAGFSANLYRRWLGLKVNNDGGAEFETQGDASLDDATVQSMRGGEGRMCLPPMLLHPIKNVELPVESNMGDDYNKAPEIEADPSS